MTITAPSGAPISSEPPIEALDHCAADVRAHDPDRYFSALFARGALKAALWGQDKAPGEYDMLDVLGLSDG